MRIGDLIGNQETYLVELEDTVTQAVHTMVEHDIGAVPVVHNGKLVGIFSERDLMRRVVYESRDPGSTSMAEVMTDDPLAVSMNDEIEDCLGLMRRHGFRHLPVCQDGFLIGMVSLRDILRHDPDQQEDEMRIVRAYIDNFPEA